jgi:cullin-associated NEDD8-dissociated protein 1
LVSHPNITPSSLQQLLSAVHDGLKDDPEIRLLALLSLQKAIEVHLASTVTPLLPAFVEPFKSIIGAKPREQAVKQEIERMEEGSKGVVRVALDVQRRFPDGVGPEWAEWWNSARTEHGILVRSVEEEVGMER